MKRERRIGSKGDTEMSIGTNTATKIMMKIRGSSLVRGRSGALVSDGG